MIVEDVRRQLLIWRKKMDYEIFIFTTTIIIVGFWAEFITRERVTSGVPVLPLVAAMQLLAGMRLGTLRGAIAAVTGGLVVSVFAFGEFRLAQILLDPFVAGGAVNALIPSFLLRQLETSTEADIPTGKAKDGLSNFVIIMAVIVFVALLPAFISTVYWIYLSSTILLFILSAMIFLLESRENRKSILVLEAIIAGDLVSSFIRSASAASSVGWRPLIYDSVSWFLWSGIYFIFCLFMLDILEADAGNFIFRYNGDDISARKSSLWSRIGYFFLLAAISSYVLVAFLEPSGSHGGINEHSPCGFLKMVDGKAARPFVYRTLLPTTIRVVSSFTPKRVQATFTDIVEDHPYLRETFNRFELETSAAYQYLVAFIIMLMCFIGFAHYAATLTLKMCGMVNTPIACSLLASAVLMGLPPFFRYTSYVYDPPQLFLFTLAIYFLGTSKLLPFLITFAVCCINKETAILLIPIYAITFHGQLASRKYLAVLIMLICWYILIKLMLGYLFRSNPGTIVQFHLLDHNIYGFNLEWMHPTARAGLILLIVSLFFWNGKPYFFRVSFICILPILVILGLYFGYVDELRDYYEAYPVAFGMMSHSFFQFKRYLDPQKRVWRSRFSYYRASR